MIIKIIYKLKSEQELLAEETRAEKRELRKEKKLNEMAAKIQTLRYPYFRKEFNSLFNFITPWQTQTSSAGYLKFVWKIFSNIANYGLIIGLIFGLISLIFYLVWGLGDPCYKFFDILHETEENFNKKKICFDKCFLDEEGDDCTKCKRRIEENNNENKFSSFIDYIYSNKAETFTNDKYAYYDNKPPNDYDDEIDTA